MAAFAPVALAYAEDELVNPLRGQYQWHERAAVPVGWATVDSYYRWNWIDIEPTRGTYNWAPIDAKVAQAKTRGGRFGLRIMALCQDCSPHLYDGAHSAIPDDLAATTNALIAKPDGDTSNYVIPDWNSETYLTRLEQLLNAIAERYRNEPHLGFVDVSGYGNYGENHLYPFDAAYATSAQRPLTATSAQRLVRINAAAFSNKTLLTTTAQSDILAAAVASSAPRIGLRIDCLGSDRLGGAENALARVPASASQWRVAPVMTEWCAFNIGSSGANPFVQGLTQLRQHHVSTIGTNFRAAPATAEEVAAFRQVNVESGYRLRTSMVELTADTAKPRELRVKATWINDNVAPTYLPWRVVIRLRGLNTVEAPLAVDLRKVLPVQTDGAFAINELVTLSDSLRTGTYTVDIRVEDTQGVSLPMRLAMPGRDATGAHVLGQLQF